MTIEIRDASLEARIRKQLQAAASSRRVACFSRPAPRKMGAPCFAYFAKRGIPRPTIASSRPITEDVQHALPNSFRLRNLPLSPMGSRICMLVPHVSH